MLVAPELYMLLSNRAVLPGLQVACRDCRWHAGTAGGMQGRTPAAVGEFSWEFCYVITRWEELVCWM